MRSQWNGLLLAGALAAHACSPPSAARSAGYLQPASLGVPATAALVVGCWVLRWDVEDDRMGGPLPDSVRLRNEAVFGTRERLISPATHPSGRGREAAGAEPWETRFVLNRWWIEDESLRLRFSDGERDEWMLSLGVDADALAGNALYSGRREPSGDAGRAEVAGVRIECQYE